MDTARVGRALKWAGGKRKQARCVAEQRGLHQRGAREAVHLGAPGEERHLGPRGGQTDIRSQALLMEHRAVRQVWAWSWATAVNETGGLLSPDPAGSPGRATTPIA